MYSQDITRKHRMAIVTLIDQSWSMAEMSDTDKNVLSKAEVVSIVAGAHSATEIIATTSILPSWDTPMIRSILSSAIR